MDTQTTSTSRTEPALDRDPRPLFRAATTTAAEVIGAVRPDQLADPTPCAGFDVRGLLTHLVGVVDRVTAIGRGDDPMQAGAAPADVADDEWLREWRDAVVIAEVAWSDDAALERAVTLPWASDTGAKALLGYVSEITVHTWDLARASGQEPAWDDETVERAYQLMRTWLPGENRAEMYAEVHAKMGVADAPDPFGAVVPVADDAAAIDRLVAWTGRRP